MIFQTAQSRSGSSESDVFRDRNLRDGVYNPTAVTKPQACELPGMPQTEVDSSESNETAYERVFRSICTGDDPNNISIPSYSISGNIVFYEVVTSNKHLRWNRWIRYDGFWKLHTRLKSHALNLGVDLPSFPKRQPKLFFNHLTNEFIEQRRVSLEGYLQMLNIDPTMRYAQDLVSFLLPSPKESSKCNQDNSNFVEENIQVYGGTWDSSSDEELELPPRPSNMLPLTMFMKMLNYRES